MKNNRTYHPSLSSINKEWLVIDADGEILGRLATKIADLLRGKGKPTYAANIDVGDYVIVINAKKIKVTGNKLSDKLYYRHTGYPGGLRETNLEKLLEQHPDRAITLAVKGMLPKNKLQQVYLKKLRVFADDNHPHEAQSPKVI